VFPLLKTFLELLFWNARQDGGPLKVVFSFGNGQKSHGAKSGEYGGWSNFIIDFLAKYSRKAYMI
jgi:hypothetical protein